MANRLYNTFTFTGQVNIPRKEDQFHKVFTNTSGFEGHKVRFAINESTTNGQYVELFGGTNTLKPFPIKTAKKRKLGEDGKYEKGVELEIPFSERLNPTYVRMVDDFRKTIIDLTTDNEAKQKGYDLRRDIRDIESKKEITDEDLNKLAELYKEHDELLPNRKEFLHAYDAALFLAEALPTLPKDTQVKVTGNLSQNIYNDKVQKHFDIRGMEVITYEGVPNALKLIVDAFFTKGAVDKESFKEDKKIYIDAYLQSYDSAIKGDNFFSNSLVINAEKLDLENPKHQGLLNLLVKTFEVKSAKEVKHIPLEVKVIRGSEEVEFDESKLTDTQKEYIALGLAALDDYKPVGRVFGETVEEYRIVKPLLEEMSGFDFRDGAIEADIEVEDLETKSPATLDIEETKLVEDSKEQVEKPKMEVLDNDSLDALFG